MNNQTPQYPKYLLSISQTLARLQSSVPNSSLFGNLFTYNLGPNSLPTSQASQQQKPGASNQTSESANQANVSQNPETESSVPSQEKIDSGLSLIPMRKEDSTSNEDSKGDLANAPLEDPKFEKQSSQDKANARLKKRNYWLRSEDTLLKSLVDIYGEKWAKIATFLEGRTGKQVRDRFVNYLRPNIKRKGWTDQEDKLLHQLYKELGNKWSMIATYLPGRTENQVKNRFYAAARRTRKGEEEKSEKDETCKEETDLKKMVKTENNSDKSILGNLKSESMSSFECESDHEDINVKSEMASSSQNSLRSTSSPVNYKKDNKQKGKFVNVKIEADQGINNSYQRNILADPNLVPQCPTELNQPQIKTESQYNYGFPGYGGVKYDSMYRPGNSLAK